MYSASDLRKGLKIQIDGQPWIITDFNFSKPGKGQAIYNCKMKNMLTGSTQTRSYRSNDKIEKPNLSERSMVYSYIDADEYVFMDENYDQVTLKADLMGDARYFLTEDLEVDVLFFNDDPVGVTLPNFVFKDIVETEPGAKGDTTTNVMKPAKIEGGYEVQVQLFVNEGDTVKIDTRTGEYVERVR